jgi:hypothetical protein
MSNTLAISAVTAAFGHLLSRVTDPTVVPIPTAATITLGPPDLSTDGQRLNLFLYGVSPNAALRNTELPVRNAAGQLTGQPSLALNLHYLLTAFGQSNNELAGHHLLAQAMSVIHDNSLLTRDHIRAALTAYQATYAQIIQSDLADQVEQVKLTPVVLSHEELTKLWSVFPTTNYRISVAYEASVVLVERRRPTRAVPPVRRALVAAVPLRRPRIDSVSPQIALSGATLTIEGHGLAAGTVLVRFPVGEPVPPSERSDTRLAVPLPATLPAGAHTVQVVQPALLGDPSTERRGFESNTAAFVLAPQIATPLPKEPLKTVARGSTLDLTVSPPVTRQQRAELLLGPLVIGRRQPPPGPQTSTLSFAIPKPTDVPTIATGEHLIQVRVGGAESPLELETTPGPDFGTYVAPKVRVT